MDFCLGWCGMFKLLKIEEIKYLQSIILILFSLFWGYQNTYAENGYKFWLRYEPIEDTIRLNEYIYLCKNIVVIENDEISKTAENELSLALSSMLGFHPALSDKIENSESVILTTLDNLRNTISKDFLLSVEINHPEGFFIGTVAIDNTPHIVIAGKTNKAILYGVFNFLRLLQTNQPIGDLHIINEPANNLRMVNHWDNPSGTIERGYAGRSIFHWGELPATDRRYEDYARMLASMGINGTVLNNVNTAKNNLTGWKLLTTPYIKKMKSLASLLRSYGVKVYLSVSFFSPIIIDKLSSADPLNPEVIKWWNEKVTEIYSEIPDFGGFLIKADSEGEPGPMKYGRTQADGANMLAGALKPHGGVLIWRTFVYGHHDMDRAMQAYSIFKPDDGEFVDNVILQIKNGPIDFQVREPVSPLFGAMPKTNQMMEFQITQEYTGHSTHLCYLVPQWKNILNFDTWVDGEGSTIAKIISGQLFNQEFTGITGVINIGSDSNWTGHHLAQANTYGFGRLAWNPGLSAEKVTEEWVRMTFSNDEFVVNVISNILLNSWYTYEDYTSPLGVGMLSNKKGDVTHFYPAPEVRENVHHADKFGVGFDRTSSSGSGFTKQYSDHVYKQYENLSTCPDELLLFFHHVPYEYQLTSGKTVIQHIYDSHFNGVDQVKSMKNDWQSLKGKIDNERFEHVLKKFDEQIVQACIWRDKINKYFFELSKINDNKGRLLTE